MMNKNSLKNKLNLGSTGGIADPTLNIFNAFYNGPQIKQLLQADASGVSGVHKNMLPFLISSYYFQHKENGQIEDILLVVPTDADVIKVCEQLKIIFSSFAGHFEGNFREDHILPFPGWGTLPYSYTLPNPEKEGLRAGTLAKILEKPGHNIVVCSADTIQQKIPDPKYYHEAGLQLIEGESYALEDILNYLNSFGYERTDVIENYGEFAIKGGVIDVFSRSYFNPVRLDFFGDDLESIQMFDPETQRSYENLSTIHLFPNRDLITKDYASEKKLNSIQKKYSTKLMPQILNGATGDLHGLWDIYPEIYDTTTLLSYFRDNPKVFVWETQLVIDRWKKIPGEFELFEKKNSDKICLPYTDFMTAKMVIRDVFEFATVALNVVNRQKDDFLLKFPEFESLRGKVSRFVLMLEKPEFSEKIIYISTFTQPQKERLEHIFGSYLAKSANLKIFVSQLSGGFSWENVIFLTEAELFGKRTRQVRFQKSSTKIIQSLSDLTNGDFVVHINYGIGRFLCLKRMKVAGNERDFLELEYADTDKLYLPLEQLGMVHKYIGSTDTPRMDYLGQRSTWSRTKEVALRSIEQTAIELLEMYAKREKSVGFAFPSDSRFQEEFEAAFPFEETEHQLSSILEVKKDMESRKPMDRLICGDVGYGKTEIAIRAAFKAVMSGKQVAILCPTTILAYQHFTTFQKRLADYPVSVNFLSRFKTSKEIKEIKSEIATGKVDIIIGTHMLLNPDLQWKELALLVVDEEQRFGVKHKESIKKMRTNVDCITLTATPIPRTLHMSLAGLRDLSLIETAPRNRRKIDTYVLENNEEILKRAIEHELEREGQVFVLHNRVQTIQLEAAKLQSLVPNASIVVLHGQMPEADIELCMVDFYNKKHDILLSTTIIESGIDIPNANTLVVMNSQNFGLSQLYQIKGRVGRSDRQAQAYFFYPREITLNENAQKRLNTLMEYDGLGSGFKVAMKDMEIRGAGNLLGEEQSGDIVSIGFELYIKMLNDKVHELKHDEVVQNFQCIVTVNMDFYFPDDYIKDTRQKMEFYKKLVSAKNSDELEDTISELRDRFGPTPEVVTTMVEVERCRLLGNNLKLEKIALAEDVINMSASPETKISMERLSAMIQKDSRFSLDPRDAKRIQFKCNSKGTLQQMQEINSVLEYLN